MTDSTTPTLQQPTRIAILATVPSTLKAFYLPLIRKLASKNYDLLIITGPGEELREFERMAGVRVCTVAFKRTISPWSDVRAVIDLCRIFRTEKIDLIHTHTPKAGLLGMLAGRLTNIPHRIHTLHGLFLETSRGLSRFIMLRIERFTCRSAHKVCVVSRSLREVVLPLKLCRPDNLIILADGTACGVDLNRFTRNEVNIEAGRQIRQSYDIPPEALVIGFVGRMVVDKGIHELITVFMELAASHSNLYLMLVGPGVDARESMSQKIVEVIQHHPRIIHTGLVEHTEQYYAAMDLLVLPTRREGFGYALLEAGAMEIPVVASRVTGCVNAVVDKETGLLVELGHREKLKDAIMCLVNDPALRHSMGQSAKARAWQIYPCERLVEAHLELYQSILSTYKSPSRRQ